MSFNFPQFHSRPVFNLTVGWDSAPGTGVVVDTRPKQIGFGVEVQEPLQTYTAHDFQVTVQIADACAINALERFFTLTYGPLRGFWLPGVETAASLVSVEDTQHMTIAPGSALAANAADDRWRYLWFVPPPGSGLDPQPAQMSTVGADPGGSGNDLVALTTGLAALPTEDWAILRLHYVRLGTSDLKLTFWNDNQARSQMRLIELPPEYTSVELGERPAFLYTFTRSAGEIVPAKVWHLTSFDQDIVQAGNTYRAAPITHSKLQKSIQGDRDGVTIDSWVEDSDNPMATFVLIPPQLQMSVAIDALRLDALAGEIVGVSTDPERLFTGTVKTVLPEGRKLVATCKSRLDSLSAQLPRFIIGKPCNYRLYNPYTCRVNPNDYRVSGTITQIDGQTLTVAITAGVADRADHWFAEGWIVAQTGDSEEYRSIADSVRVSATVQQIVANYRFSTSVVVGASFVAYAGCDLSAATCTAKFSNFVNFGGHPQLQNDLGIHAINQKAAGGKGGK